MVISTSQVNRKTWRKGLESNHFWSTGEFGVPFKKYQKVVVQQTQLQNMLVKKGSSSPSFGMNIKQIETTSWDSGLRRSLRFFQWKKTALNVSKKHPNPAFMISTLKEIDSGNRWSLWLLKKLSCILLLKKNCFRKIWKKCHVESHWNVRWSSRKNIWKNHPWNHLPQLWRPKTIQNPSECPTFNTRVMRTMRNAFKLLIPATWWPRFGPRPAAVLSQEGKKWRLETKGEPIWWKSENDRVSKSSKKNIPCTSSKGWCFEA